MSNLSYTTVGGETAINIAFQFYKNSTKSNIIIDANPSVFHKFDNKPGMSIANKPLDKNIVLVIPSLSGFIKQSAGTSKNKNSTPLIDDRKFPQKVPTTLKSEDVTLFIDGKRFLYFDDLNLNLSFDSIADTFSMSVPNDSKNKEFIKLMRPFSYKEMALYIGGEKLFTGNIITLKTTNDSNSKKINIDGYSKTGILNDCSPSPYTPLNFVGLDLMQIADKLCQPYGISIIFESEQGAKFTQADKIQLDRNKKIIEILTPLAKMRGLVISNTRHGELLFHKTDSDIASMRIESGKPPCFKSDASFNGQNRFSDITLTKQNTGKAEGKIIVLRDEELAKQGVFRATVQTSENSEDGNLTNAGIAKIGRTIAESTQINASCFGWRRPDGDIWFPGQKILYKAADDFIFNFTEVIVKTVNFVKSNNSQVTNLSLCLPQCCSGEFLRSYPWDLSEK